MLRYLEEGFLNFQIAGMTLYLSSQSEVRKLLSTHVPGTLDGIINSSVNSDVVFKYNDFNRIFPIAPFNNHASVNNYVCLQALSTIINGYEMLKTDLKSKRKWKDFKLLPKEIQLFKYLRDAAAHNNKFSLSDTRILPLNWRNKTLSPENNETPLFPNFMTYGDIYYFFEDVSRVEEKL